MKMRSFYNGWSNLHIGLSFTAFNGWRVLSVYMLVCEVRVSWGCTPEWPVVGGENEK